MRSLSRVRENDGTSSVHRAGWRLARVVVVLIAGWWLAAASASAQSALDLGEAVAPIFSPEEPSGGWLMGPVLKEEEPQPATSVAPFPPRHPGMRVLLKNLARDTRHLPSWENLLWIGVGSGLALSAHAADDDVQRSVSVNATAEQIFKRGEVLGQLGTLMGAASVVYATGRLKDEPKVSHVGMDLIRALAISEGLTQTLKYASRRERPDQSGRTSFPSGHAADTFALATALERHLGWRVAVPAYAFASYVAASRLTANRHWVSDIVFGAAVGIVAGRSVTGDESQKYPMTIACIPGGAMIQFVRRHQ